MEIHQKVFKSPPSNSDKLQTPCSNHDEERLVLRDLDVFKGHDNLEIGFTITSLQDLPDWEPEVTGNTRRIEALKTVHELGIKTYVSMEPWIPEVTKPLDIMSALKDWVDRWIIGALNYFGWDRYCHEIYRLEMPQLLRLTKT